MMLFSTRQLNANHIRRKKQQQLHKCVYIQRPGGKIKRDSKYNQHPFQKYNTKRNYQWIWYM